MVPPALTRLLLFVAIAVTTLAAACTSGTDVATEVASATVIAAPEPTATAVATAEPTATTTPTAALTPSPSPTAEPIPTPTLDPVARAEADIEEIKLVHTRFMTELLARDERDEASVAKFLRLADELTAGEQLEFIRDSLAERQTKGEYVAGDGALSNVGDINIYSDGLVEVFDCSLSTSVIVDDLGGSTVPEEHHEWRATYLRLQPDDAWRIEFFDARIDEQCVPAT